MIMAESLLNDQLQSVENYIRSDINQIVAFFSKILPKCNRN